MPAYLLWPISFLLALFVFSLAVFIHELGHFLVARLLGLRADVFSIGFGPAIWKKTIRGTEVRLSWIPFGGYVSLPQLDPEGMQKLQGDHSDKNTADVHSGETVVCSEDHRSAEPLPPAAPWKRILVALAGPMGNVVLAFVCAVIIYLFAPAEALNSSTTVGFVPPQTAAAQAGMRAGDEIVSVNGRAISSWSEFQTECLLTGGTNTLVTLTFRRDQQSQTVQVPLDQQIEDSEFYQVSGLYPETAYALEVHKVLPETPAAVAGLLPNDRILTVNGNPCTTATVFFDREDPAAPVLLTVKQPEAAAPVRQLTVTPTVLTMPDETAPVTTPRMGVVVGMRGKASFPWMVERGIWAQIRGDAAGVFRVLGALTAPKQEGERGRVAKSLGGPLMIFGLLFQVVQVGLWVSLGFLRLICINLAILNLLPLPVLDGGHIIFATYAMIRRKEPSARVIGWLTNGFAFLLIGVMLWFLYSDSIRLFDLFTK